jgi:hypothetical protein
LGLFARNLKSLVLFLIIFLLAGCSKQSLYVPLVEEDREAVRLITSGTNQVVELTNSRYKLLVYSKSTVIIMKLFIPTGEELFVQEPSRVFANSTTQRTLKNYQRIWAQSRKMDAVADADFGTNTDINRPGFVGDADRLVGLESSPPATIYTSFISIIDEEYRELILKPPVFRTRENEIVEFENISFKVEKNTSTTINEWYVDDVMDVVIEVLDVIRRGEIGEINW